VIAVALAHERVDGPRVRARGQQLAREAELERAGRAKPRVPQPRPQPPRRLDPAGGQRDPDHASDMSAAEPTVMAVDAIAEHRDHGRRTRRLAHRHAPFGLAAAGIADEQQPREPDQHRRGEDRVSHQQRYGHRRRTVPDQSPERLLQIMRRRPATFVASAKSGRPRTHWSCSCDGRRREHGRRRSARPLTSADAVVDAPMTGASAGRPEQALGARARTRSHPRE
jgi:hypothetical protein